MMDNHTLKKTYLYILLVLTCMIYAIPFYLLINIALKYPTDVSSHWFVSQKLNLQNFSDVWREAELPRILLNNIIITMTTMAIVLFLGSMAAYPLARRKSALNKFIYSFCVATLIVPGLTILVPLYKTMVDINGINTYWGIVMVHAAFGLPFTVFLYTGFINTIPKELDEAAIIDGCNRFQVFFNIIIRLLQPVMAALLILNGVALWNDYQFSLFFLQKPKMHTYTVALSQFFSRYNSNPYWVAAGCIIGMMPITLIYLSLQKYFINSAITGVIKG